MPVKLNYTNFTAPGQLSEVAVFRVSLTGMLALYCLDVFTSSVLTLQSLYILLIVAIVLHCGSKVLASTGVVVGIVLQVFPYLLLYTGISIPTIANVVSIILPSLLWAYFARLSRNRFLRVIGESSTDSLTGLGNRRALEEFLSRAIIELNNPNAVFSVVVLDLDGFKLLNDSRGHFVGDTALRLLADVLRLRVRKTDFAARIGGDEFAIVLMHTHGHDGEIFCKQLLDVIAPVMEKEGMGLTASIGCKTFLSPPSSIAEALHQADLAMYAAKNNGKDCLVCY